MANQLPLFEIHAMNCVERLWQQLDLQTREQVAELLAEMASASLDAKRQAPMKEQRHDT